MNKNDVLNAFKKAKAIERTILNFKSESDLRDEIIEQMKIQNIPLSELKEELTTFKVCNMVIFKPIHKEVEIIESLPYDVKGNTIKEYGLNYIITDYAKYTILEE